MLEALKAIGSIQLAQENKEAIDILLQNPDSNGKYKIVWFIEFDKLGKFIRVSQEDLKKESFSLYLYRQGSGSNAPDFSPTSRVTELPKTFNRLQTWFKNHRSYNNLFTTIYQELQDYKEVIIEKLQSFDTQLPKNINKVLSIKVDGRYLYECEIFKKVFIEDFFKKIEEVAHLNGICSICGEQKDKIFTTSALYRFYTLDKECYITSGFNKKEAWKNFPICRECFLAIDYGKKFVEEHLHFHFYNHDYYLIPQMLLESDAVLESILDILRFSQKELRLQKSSEEQIVDDEEILQEIVKDANDFISLYLLFLKRSNKAERIELLLEDILPSRIHTIIETKKAIQIQYGSFHLGELFTFCDTQRRFFEITDKIFRGGRLSLKFLIALMIQKMRGVVHENKKLCLLALQSIKSLKYLELLAIIKTKGYRMNDQFDSLFEQIGAGLDSEVKRGIFLLGVLTQKLLVLQQKQRGSMPFMQHLKSLKMNQKDLLGLLPKVINKFHEYGHFNKCEQTLAAAISDYLLKQPSAKLSVDELNFYFAAGMALSYRVTQAICKGADDEE